LVFLAGKDHRGINLISDVLPFGRLWWAGSNAVSNAIGYAKFRSRSHDAVISVYDDARIALLSLSRARRHVWASWIGSVDPSRRAVRHNLDGDSFRLRLASLACCPFAREQTLTERLASSCNRAATLRSDALPPSLLSARIFPAYLPTYSGSLHHRPTVDDCV
jgi:hypothetical protein